MAKIKQGAGDQGKGRQTRRRGEFAKHHVVDREVQGRDDNPKRDGLGYRPLDRSGGERRVDVGADRQWNRWLDPPPEA